MRTTDTSRKSKGDAAEAAKIACQIVEIGSGAETTVDLEVEAKGTHRKDSQDRNKGINLLIDREKGTGQRANIINRQMHPDNLNQEGRIAQPPERNRLRFKGKETRFVGQKATACQIDGDLAAKDDNGQRVMELDTQTIRQNPDQIPGTQDLQQSKECTIKETPTDTRIQEDLASQEQTHILKETRISKDTQLTMPQ